MSIPSTGLGRDERLVVSPNEAKTLLNIGTTRLYELLSEQELDSYKDGKARKITMASIRRYVERKLAAGEQPFPKRAGASRIRQAG
jgi:excisionase family DNA binding protein